MNPAIINMILVSVMFIAVIIYIMYYWSRHKIYIDLSLYDGGVFKSKGGRFRQSKSGKLYRMSDMLSRSPLDIDLADYTQHLITSEGMPLLGSKYTLNIKKVRLSKPEIVQVPRPKKEIRKEMKVIAEIAKAKRRLGESYNPPKINDTEPFEIWDKYIAWQPPIAFSKKHILNDFKYRYYKAMKLKIFNDTKTQTNADMFREIAVPLGLIILAIALVLFLPKILEAVREPALGYVKTEISTWQEMLQSIRPGA